MLRLLMTILWPAFLVAIVAEGCFFSLFDPRELTLTDGRELRPLAIYTIGFFFFWAVSALAGGLTYFLTRGPDEAGSAGTRSGARNTAS